MKNQTHGGVSADTTLAKYLATGSQVEAGLHVWGLNFKNFIKTLLIKIRPQKVWGESPKSLKLGKSN